MAERGKMKGWSDDAGECGGAQWAEEEEEEEEEEELTKGPASNVVSVERETKERRGGTTEVARMDSRRREGICIKPRAGPQAQRPRLGAASLCSS